MKKTKSFALLENTLSMRLLRVLILCLVLVSLAEFLLSNYRMLFVYSKEDYPYLDPSEHCTDTPLDDGSYLVKSNTSLSYKDIPVGLYSVTFEIGYAIDTVDATLPVPTVRIMTHDPRTTWQNDGFVTVAEEQIPIGEAGTFRTVTVYASTVRNTEGDLLIRFSNLKSDVTVKNIELNVAPRLAFSAPRVFFFTLLLFLPFLLVLLGLTKTNYDPQNVRHRLGVRTAVLFTVLIALIAVSVFLPAHEEIPYPLEGAVRYYQPYIQQFDAFMKGQLHLDVPVSDEMLSLENPYDYNTREDANPLWDRAYYDGHYYSYFGVTPILLVYFPYYLFTGGLPSDTLVMAVFLLISAVFIPLTVLKWADLHEKKTIPLPLLWISAVVAFIGSIMILLARGVTPFYYIATLAGSAMLSVFLFLLLKAAEQKTCKERCFFYVLAGISYALLLHARLNIALLAAFIVLPYLAFRVLKRRAEDGEANSVSRIGKIKAWFAPPKEILVSLLSLGAPVAVGLFGALLLNYLRFDSIFEFGTRYQLTVSDIRYNALSLADLWPAIYHYFFQPLATSPLFPFFSLGRMTASNYGHYVYVDTGLGLFSIPLMKALLLSPAVFLMKSRTRYEKILLLFVLSGLLVLALLNFSLGGVIFRYTADMTTLAAIASVCILLALYGAFARKTDTAAEEDALEGNSECTAVNIGARAAGTAITVFFIVSTAVILLLTLSENANLTKYALDNFIHIRNFFTFK